MTVHALPVASESAGCEAHGRPMEGCRSCFIRGLHIQLDAWRDAHAAQVARAEAAEQRIAELERELAFANDPDDPRALPPISTAGKDG